MNKDAYQRELEREKEAACEAVRKYNRAQERLNRAAVAWWKYWLARPDSSGIDECEDPRCPNCKLWRAVRAFEKASKL